MKTRTINYWFIQYNFSEPYPFYSQFHIHSMAFSPIILKASDQPNVISLLIVGRMSTTNVLTSSPSCPVPSPSMIASGSKFRSLARSVWLLGGWLLAGLSLPWLWLLAAPGVLGALLWLGGDMAAGPCCWGVMGAPTLPGVPGPGVGCRSGWPSMVPGWFKESAAAPLILAWDILWALCKLVLLPKFSLNWDNGLKKSVAALWKFVSGPPALPPLFAPLPGLPSNPYGVGPFAARKKGRI